MNKGSRAAASLAKPKEGKMDHSKPAGGKVMPPMTTVGRTGTKVKKG